MFIHNQPDKSEVGQYVPIELVKDWPKMADSSANAFRKFTGIGREGYNLVRKGPRIFAVGSELAKCVYNHTREF